MNQGIIKEVNIIACKKLLQGGRTVYERLVEGCNNKKRIGAKINLHDVPRCV